MVLIVNDYDYDFVCILSINIWKAIGVLVYWCIDALIVKAVRSIQVLLKPSLLLNTSG